MITINSQTELDDFFKTHPNVLVGMMKGFGCVHVKTFDNWKQIPHDTYRMGVYMNGKQVNPPKSWDKQEKRVQSRVGRE